MTATHEHDFRAATADAKRRLEGAKRLQHLAARRAAEAFLAGDLPNTDDVASYERVLAGLAALQVRARCAELEKQMDGYHADADKLGPQITPLEHRLDALHRGEVAGIANYVERDQQMNAARAEMASLEGRISSFRDRVRELAKERDEFRKQYPEAFYEAT